MFNSIPVLVNAEAVVVIRQTSQTRSGTVLIGSGPATRDVCLIQTVINSSLLVTESLDEIVAAIKTTALET